MYRELLERGECRMTAVRTIEPVKAVRATLHESTRPQVRKLLLDGPQRETGGPREFANVKLTRRIKEQRANDFSARLRK